MSLHDIIAVIPTSELCAASYAADAVDISTWSGYYCLVEEARAGQRGGGDRKALLWVWPGERLLRDAWRLLLLHTDSKHNGDKSYERQRSLHALSTIRTRRFDLSHGKRGPRCQLAPAGNAVIAYGAKIVIWFCYGKQWFCTTDMGVGMGMGMEMAFQERQGKGLRVGACRLSLGKTACSNSPTFRLARLEKSIAGSFKERESFLRRAQISKSRLPAHSSARRLLRIPKAVQRDDRTACRMSVRHQLSKTP